MSTVYHSNGKAPFAKKEGKEKKERSIFYPFLSYKNKRDKYNISCLVGKNEINKYVTYTLKPKYLVFIR